MNTKAKQLTERAANPFAKATTGEAETAGAAMLQSQAEATVQGMVVAAKRFPRVEEDSMNRILDACTRVSLAQEALYEFPRGGSSVTGPSIRLAEVIAQNWGNIQFGINEISNHGGRSQVEAYAWDLETNVRQAKVFMTDHVRRVGRGDQARNKILTDPRDIYEMVANQGARRMRSCILAIIPKDVVDQSVNQIYLTLQNSMDAPAEEIAGLVKAFAALGISEAAIKKRLGKNLDKVSAAEVIRFRQIYKSLVDGMSEPGQWFELDAKTEAEEKTETTEALKDRLRKGDDRPTVPSEGAEAETPPSVIRDVNGTAFEPDLHVTDKQTGEIVFNKDGSFRKRPQKPLDHEYEGGEDPGPTEQDLI